MRIYDSEFGEIFCGDVLDISRGLPDESVKCCVTSPPYWGLRDYGVAGQLGLESTPEEYVEKLVEIFREGRRVLRDDGTVWLNLGDSYAGAGQGGGGNRKGNEHGQHDAMVGTSRGLKPKDLVGIPWRVAFALQADGWYLRQDIIWHKPNPMPESVTDRCTKSHEYIFLLSKSARYYYDNEAIKEPAKWERWGDQTENKQHSGTASHLGGKSTSELPIKDTKNKRSVWTVPTRPFSGAHFAVFPPQLIEPCILAGCPEGGVVLDPFFGSGTTGIVAHKFGRRFIGIDLNRGYLDDIAIPRIKSATSQLKMF